MDEGFVGTGLTIAVVLFFLCGTIATLVCMH